MAIWTLIPDKIEEEETQIAQRFGVVGATFVTFFLAEMGDKTQIATVAMAVHYGDPLLVVMGSTLGMLIADVPAVFLGNRLADRIPMKLVHTMPVAIFAALGVGHTGCGIKNARSIQARALDAQGTSSALGLPYYLAMTRTISKHLFE
ncbi:hypothetical protein B9Z39_08495 [Limnohabitans sp. JirII-29]|uniref:TMEM165/GDT1 family protein n=1 Tax=unclassified Limnohabitans TaxID=2626134 RepID=UPI000C1ECEFE|nr:hypothetical protein B9Z41_08115 [Limnohabitans sp. JirII-31]PUE27779.1 hypothetical protein B9Z39_08495 [Limnohabitans sp. JirII-29]